MNGITAATVKNLVLDAAVVYLNYGETGGEERILGATKGGATFKVTRDIRTIEVDGALGPVKGMRRIVAENAVITANMLEFSADNLLKALAGTTKGDFPAVTPTHDKITSTGKISDTDYLANVAIVGTVSGSADPVVCLISNALGDGGLSVATKDKDEAAIEVQFTAHYDPAALATVPWEVRYPKIV